MRNSLIQYAFALVFSCVLWFSVVLYQDYNYTLKIPVNYTNVPSTLKLTSALPEEIELNIRGNGNSILLPSLGFTDTIKVNLAEKITSGKIEFNKLIKKNNSLKQLEIVSMNPDTFSFSFIEKIEKKVPVLSNIKMKFEEGYNIHDQKFYPDSITLLGSPEELENITHWETESKELELQNKVGEITVNLNKNNNINVIPDQTILKYNASKYIEVTTLKKVEVINLPFNKTLRVFPENIAIKFAIPIDEYENFENSKIKVVLDYLKISPNYKYLVPEIQIDNPKYKYFHLSPSKLSYVITSY